MLHSCHLRLLAALGLAVLLAFAPGASADAAAKQKQLDALKAKLSKVQEDREQDLKRRDAVQLDLRRTERIIADLGKQVSDLEAQLRNAQGRLLELQQQQSAHQAQLDTQKAALAQQIQAAFMEGRDSQLKLLLDAQDPASVGRLLAYYDYLNRARIARIDAVRKQLDALNVLDAQIQDQLASLKDLRDDRARKLTELEQERGERKQVLTRIDSTIRSRDTQIAHLKSDRDSMQALVNQLQQALTDVPPELEQGKRFASLRGHLLWPVNGTVINRFGQPRAGGGRIKWDGDLIAAPVGTAVRAVSYGRVVYADWMPHFGLVLILDHGEGYMSVYAHNQNVTHQVGEWVRAGDTVATLGESGGQEQPALYFELRHGTDTLDPRKWCKGRLPGS